MRKRNSYLESIKEYQNKMYLPGFYTGRKINPYLLAKTKAGGYFLLLTGSMSLLIFLIQLLRPIRIESLAILFFLFIYAVLALAAGIKFIRLNKKAKK